MAKGVQLEDLGGAIACELTVYSKDVQDKVNAPYNARAYHRHFAELIATTSEKSRTGDETHTWYVKPPGQRLTHLLVNGHETRDGGRTKGDPFLQNALADVLPDYEKEVEEAVKP